ncbi:MAG: hypothetical protein JWP88_1057 [Flaviaesturariibacter sp.]|nr:hypothetical protein [Flaviaesturariibacter sp.]
MKYSLLVLTVLFATRLVAQREVKGVVADSATRKGLPFATLQLDDQKSGVITDINGHFSIYVKEGQTISLSYIAHAFRTLKATNLTTGDTLFLSPSATAMGEVVIRSDEKKITRIVNTAVRNKPLNNPEQYASYECNVYYKMSADLLGLEYTATDSTRRDSIRLAKGDTSKLAEEPDFFSPTRHLLFAETFSKRLYRKPQQLQEVVLASRFSGMKKTYFHNTVTDVLPFHLYTDYINLGGVDYNNPIARGWQSRYRFRLQDELRVGRDTVFLLSFEPKPGTAFNGLQGVVYINSNGYAISHFIAATGDTTKDRQIRFEQVYQFTGERWFPRELNYQLTMKHIISKAATMKWNGHSVIDSVFYDQRPSYAFDKAHPVRLHDSIDLRTPEEWSRFRGDTITARERDTYVFMDSFTNKYGLEKIIIATSRLNMGRIPIGKIDLDINRLLAQNDYEGTRLGAGFYTNDKISNRFSIGGWAGYGFTDRRWKGGASFTVYPGRGKEAWIALGWQDAYRNPGEVRLHEDLYRKGLRNWLLGKPERVQELTMTGNLRKGYLEFRPELLRQQITPLYLDSFTVGGKPFKNFNTSEAGIGLRYAYAERRVPVFDYYMPEETKYPIVYLRVSKGRINSGSYSAGYWRTLAAITYTFHGNRWGRDYYRLEGGWVYSPKNGALPRTLLLAGNGIRTARSHYYSPTGFVTMRPFDYFSDHYLSLLYRHEFDRFFWDAKWSKPFLSLAHNSVVGGLSKASAAANSGISSFSKGYHESGLMINQLLRYNIHVTDVYLNIGGFYHWNKAAAFEKNAFWVFSISTRF